MPSGKSLPESSPPASGVSARDGTGILLCCRVCSTLLRKDGLRGLAQLAVLGEGNGDRRKGHLEKATKETSAPQTEPWTDTTDTSGAKLVWAPGWDRSTGAQMQGSQI